MDPNATLKELRELTQHVLTDGSTCFCERISELVDALDQWISKGGFLPQGWTK